jgi:hypothetical protein
VEISRINARTSWGTVGRPVRCRLFQVQNRRKSRRCHATTVSGFDDLNGRAPAAPRLRERCSAARDRIINRNEWSSETTTETTSEAYSRLPLNLNRHNEYRVSGRYTRKASRGRGDGKVDSCPAEHGPAARRRCQVVRAIRRLALHRARDQRGRAFRPSQTSRRDSERGRLRDDVPFPPAPAHHRAIVGCRERMAAGPKLVADRTEHRTEARRVPQALEPLQTSLTLADGLVRVLDAIVWPAASEM